MNYKLLTKAYWDEQKERTAKNLEKIKSRDVNLTKGLAIPNDGDLPIGTGRRMWMSVLFLDICKFTARPNNSAEEQEANLRAMTIFFGEMIKIIEDYGGTVEKNTGDGLMAYFEDSGYSSNGETRAVAAAMMMNKSHRELIAPQLASERLAPIEFRIGIDSGFVTVAEVGASRGFHGIVAIGITANIASKILDVAKSGEIVIGSWVAQHLPAEWGSLIKPHTPQTGIQVTRRDAPPEPYPFFKFDGYWTTPSS